MTAVTNDMTAGAGNLLVAGVDEAGRGPLVGAVAAAAVILDPARPIAGIRDSKKLSAARREQLAAEIKAQALAYAVVLVEPHEIDALNILQASLTAMARAVEALTIAPDLVLVDGNRLPKWRYRARAIVKGDDLEPAIGAASILAKVARDATMRELDARHPQYGFARHKGYPTREHLLALEKWGPLPEHRRSFGPVAKYSSRRAGIAV